jgi:hypothetical protein
LITLGQDGPTSTVITAGFVLHIRERLVAAALAVVPRSPAVGEGADVHVLSFAQNYLKTGEGPYEETEETQIDVLDRQPTHRRAGAASRFDSRSLRRGA